MYRVEFHCHSKEDPIDNLNYTAEQAIDAAAKVGVQALAFTWHQKIFDRPDLVGYAKEKGILLVSGVEAEIGSSHVILLNLKPGDLNPSSTNWDEIRALRARRPEVFVIAPHPFYIVPFCLGTLMDKGVDCIDAVEWCHAHASFIPLSLSPNGWAKNWSQKHGKPLLACSDAHSVTRVGRYCSEVDASELTTEAIFAAIRANKVRFDTQGLSFLTVVRLAARLFVDLPYHIATFFRGKRLSRKKARLEY